MYDDVERVKSFARKLATVRVLWRAPDTLDLWGIPYEMREGQTPYDLFKSRVANHADWIWLGQPGWWGHLSGIEQTVIKAFLEKHAEHVPRNPPDFSTLPRAT